MKGRVLCVGRNSLDLVFNVELARLRPDSKQRTSDPAVLVGGQCVNAAVTLAGLGCAVSYAGVVGGDAGAERVLAFLQERGIDCAAVETAAGMANPCAYIMVDAKTGERSIVETAPDSFPRFTGRIAEKLWAVTSSVYFDGHEEDASIAIAAEAARRGVPTLTDAETLTEGTRELLSLADTAIVPGAVAMELAGSDRPDDMLRALAALGGTAHVVTLGEEGAFGAVAGGTTHRVPAFPCNAIDTTGAGDAFHAGFLFAKMAGAAFPDAMTFAARVAAKACEVRGANLDARTLALLGADFSR
ncbi:PfkB domain protein [Parvibaculum lavamentivorans DS-1]|uniref:PfkB domain protein n=1 Tax=Parvibaculum lavamentivorans (strain DS-1 / DSM 13023 / NCIMB 13966) TaxID=402881 RepID=A7HRS0_PARL1|nr:PfkB family carbohydrate kinase [Parvibaculum lavamentivorans]ABS62603.1 PfkB domain protein [Parvibaculum lavamentivorans DS-1]